MLLKLKKFEVSAGKPIIFLNAETAKSLDLHVGDRVQASYNSKSIIGRLDITKNFLSKDEIALSDEIRAYLHAHRGQNIEVSLVPTPKSTIAIRKKMNGKKLTREEIYQIIQDVVDNALTEAEIAQFIVGVYGKGMSYKETVYLTEAMYKTGTVLDWGSKVVVDKHSIGGIAGNRTTPIVVSICAAAGVTMPKTSSRAITSAAGTADVIETITHVNFSAEVLKKIVKKAGACLAWGGSLGLSPSDDKLIKIERILNLDPESQLVASILSKKLAVGSTHVLIDIPYGPGAKVNFTEANKLRKKFLAMARSFNLKMEVVLTDGTQPIGNGIGPVLEMMDIFKVLKRDNPPEDLEKKSILLAGKILEMAKRVPRGKGKSLAIKMLNTGAALKKFEEIIDMQGRKDIILMPAKYSQQIKAERGGKISRIDNKGINRIASILGCPVDKRAGIYLYHHIGDKVSQGEIILTLYSESQEKLEDALNTFNLKSPVSID